LSDSARIASAIPGASRSITALVASGVTSSCVRPVPPVVKMKLVCASGAECLRSASSIWARSSETTSRATTSAPASAASCASASPEMSSLRPAATEVEMVMIAALTERPSTPRS